MRRDQLGDPRVTCDRLRRFVEVLLQWNISVSNLISKNDEARVVEAHVLPAVEAAGWIRSLELKRWCDLGSGGGFPALPLAICGVGEAWDLVESRRTKTLFLRRAVGELQLAGVRVLSARIEDLLADRAASSAAGGHGDEDGNIVVPQTDGGAWSDSEGGVTASDGGEESGWGEELKAATLHVEPRPQLGAEYDGFTSRATLALGPTLFYAARLVRSGGRAFLWKGSRLAEEAGKDPSWGSWWEQGEVRQLSVEHSVVASFVRNKQ